MTASTLDLLVPIKPLHLAKSRLLGAADGGAGRPDAHAALVRALTLDTVEAARAADRVRRVAAVTSDPELSAILREAGVEVIPDVPSGSDGPAGWDGPTGSDGPAAGLNAALRHGAALLTRPHPGTRVGALQADLPALRPAELDAAIAGAAEHRGFCPDRQGTGTTLLLADPGGQLDPRFGPGSAAAHAASAAMPLDGPWPSLRCDVDTVADLRAAASLGLGPHTAARVPDLAANAHATRGWSGRTARAGGGAT